jgi:hypothetical protein
MTFHGEEKSGPGIARTCHTLRILGYNIQDNISYFFRVGAITITIKITIAECVRLWSNDTPGNVNVTTHSSHLCAARGTVVFRVSLIHHALERHNSRGSMTLL